MDFEKNSLFRISNIKVKKDKTANKRDYQNAKVPSSPSWFLKLSPVNKSVMFLFGRPILVMMSIKKAVK
jgi:hypothetical protein